MVEHLLLKEFYYNDSVESKIIIEDLEANLAGAPIDASNHDDLAVAEEVNADESITAVAKDRNEMGINIEEEHNKEAYKETMNIYIENMDKFLKSHKH